MTLLLHAIALVVAVLGVTACCAIGLICGIESIKVTGQETWRETWRWRGFALVWFVLAAWGIIWFAQVTS